MKLSPNEMAWCLLKAGFAPPVALVGVAVGLGEADGDTEALGHRSTDDPAYGNYDHGWLQGSNKWHGAKLQANPDWRDPLVCARIAKLIYDERERIQRSKGETVDGWLAWTVYKNGHHVKFLPAAEIGMQYPWPPPRTARSLLGRLRTR